MKAIGKTICTMVRGSFQMLMVRPTLGILRTELRMEKVVKSLWIRQCLKALIKRARNTDKDALTGQMDLSLKDNSSMI